MTRSLLGCFLALLVACAAAAAPGKWSCALTHVVDGDTLYARCDGERVKVRLLRIDTAERNEPGYQSATDALRGLIGDQTIRLEFEKPGLPVTDDYDRLLVYVFAGDRNVNVEMVRLGWSRFFTRYGKGRLAKDFMQAEQEARVARRGIWAVSSEPAPVPPSSPSRLFSPGCRARHTCCRICTGGTACGNTCISASAACDQAVGCACDAEDICTKPTR